MTSNRSFAGDLLEPFSWIADVTVMDAFESGTVDLPDFYFTGDDYRYRFMTEAKWRFLDLLGERFNTGVKCENRMLKWDTVIERKALMLGRCLVGRCDRLDFVEPSPSLRRLEDSELRTRILSLSQPEAQRLGIEKSTLHYLRKRARSDGSLKAYHRVHERLCPDPSKTEC